MIRATRWGGIVVSALVVGMLSVAYGDEAQVRAALDKKISLEVVEVPLSQVAEMLTEKMQVNVRLHNRSLEADAVGLDTPVTRILNDLSARSVLNLLTRDFGIGWRIRKWGIEIVGSELGQQSILTQVTDVSDLLATGDGPNAARERQDLTYELGYAIELLGFPIPGWSSDGGIGLINFDTSGNLIVSSGSEVHDEVARLLQSLRVAAKLPESKPSGKVPMSLGATHESDAKITAKLAQTIDVDFQEAPLKEVVEWLMNRTKTVMAIDRRGLESAGIGSHVPVTARLRGARLDDVLETILDSVGLTFVIRDEIVLVTTREEAQKRLDVRVYPMYDFVPTENRDVMRDELSRLIGLIEKHVAHPTPNWGTYGGVGDVAMVSIAKSLVVRTTPEAHLKVEEFLNKLRAARGTRSVSLPTEPSLETRVYNLKELLQAGRDNLTPEERQSLLKLRLSEFDFNGNRPSWQIFGDLVAIRQTTPIHRQLDRVLVNRGWCGSRKMSARDY